MPICIDLIRALILGSPSVSLYSSLTSCLVILIDFDKIKNHFSQTDLYTFAGNSIVVDVAEELLCMMFDEEGEFFI